MKKFDLEVENLLGLCLPYHLSNIFTGFVSHKVMFEAAAVVAQSVKCPELRSLEEVQLSQHEFDSRSRHRS